MKKLINNIGLSCLGLCLNSCVDFIDNAPDDTLTLEMVFDDKVRMEDWLSGVYNKIPDPYWGMLRDYGYDSMGDDLDPSQRWYQWWGNTLNFVIGQFNMGCRSVERMPTKNTFCLSFHRKCPSDTGAACH